VYSSLVRAVKSLGYFSAIGIILVCMTASAHAQAKKASAPAAKPAAPAKAAAPAHPAGGGAGASHGATTTASHGPTTGGSAGGSAASHGPTTSNPHGTTTTASHGATTSTAGHGATTTAGHSTTTAGGAGHTGGESGSRESAGGAAGHGGAGHPAPAGSHEAHTANGSSVRTRANGSRSDVHDAKRNMDIHHGLNGNRRVSVERADHSRVVAERGGRGYVQHPFGYHGHEYGRRAYFDHGRRYDRFYGRYPYRGVYVDVYAPALYYPPAFYGWAYNPWAAPVVYAGWGWAGTPWYGVYGGFFTPFAVYPSASYWLTDYLIAASLQAAYAAQVDAQIAAAANPDASPLTPEVKKMIADEVQRQVALENSEAQQNAQGQDIDSGSSGIARMLSDNQPHVFVAGSDLDLVADSGQECAVSQGDVIEVATSPAADATAAGAIVLSSKGGKECAKSTNVTVAFTDLQDMQNHMRETIDQGMSEMKDKQGKGGLPAAPPSAQAPPTQSAFAAIAPPPDPNAAAEIKEQAGQADASEQEVASAAGAGAGGAAGGPAAPADPVPAAAPAAPVSIAIGQTIDQVTAALGMPKSKIDLGSKQIYVYQDMKITFKGGKVSDVQ
jgi:hypothetical protein